MKAGRDILFLLIGFCLFSCSERRALKDLVINSIKDKTIHEADSLLYEKVVTVTDTSCARSAGGIHDFYSEGDYWWPDPENSDGPYIQKDGQSNPGNFSAHRSAMIRLNEITSTLTSAWLLTGNRKYAEKAVQHLNAWFVDTATMMNPNMIYAQAVKGRSTGRSIGLIDACHLVEVIKSARILIDGKMIPERQSEAIKSWCRSFLNWMTTHPYGVQEMNAKNNHGTCWVVTAAAMADLVSDKKMKQFCINRFKTVLLPNQMAADGSFPLEINRTKPYGYSLFNMDTMCNIAQILSTRLDNLWNFSTPDGRNLHKGMNFIYPFITDKSKWPFPRDIYIWEEWPVRQSCLLFAGLAWDNDKYIDTYLHLNGNPSNSEVLRNLPVRHPVIWLMDAPCR